MQKLTCREWLCDENENNLVKFIYAVWVDRYKEKLDTKDKINVDPHLIDKGMQIPVTYLLSYDIIHEESHFLFIRTSNVGEV